MCRCPWSHLAARGPTACHKRIELGQQMDTATVTNGAIRFVPASAMHGDPIR